MNDKYVRERCAWRVRYTCYKSLHVYVCISVCITQFTKKNVKNNRLNVT
jgi:hypothetical protein